MAPRLMRRLTFQQQLDDLRRDIARAAIEFFIREVGNRMRHGKEFEILEAPRAGHRLAGTHEYVGDDGCRRYTVLFEYYAVEHTARAA